MEHQNPVIPKRPRGRPRKEKSDAILTHRLEVLFSDQDLITIQTIRTLAGLASAGQVVRQALANELKRLHSRAGIQEPPDMTYRPQF